MPELKEPVAGMLEKQRKERPNILFIIERSKNMNIVVYEADVKDGKLDPKEPVKAFWLDIDPEYVKRAGEKSDKVELSMVEWSMAYGYGDHMCF